MKGGLVMSCNDEMVPIEKKFYQNLSEREQEEVLKKSTVQNVVKRIGKKIQRKR